MNLVRGLLDRIILIGGVLCGGMTPSFMAHRTVTFFLAPMVLAYLAICAALFAFQRSLIYFPQRFRGNSISAPGALLPRLQINTIPRIRFHCHAVCIRC